jgi:hypothetical protein
LGIKEMMFGYNTKDELSNAKKLILVYFKMYAYQCKMLNLSLSMIAAQNYITQKLKTDKEVAIINNRLPKFDNVCSLFRKFMSLFKKKIS